MRNDILTSLRHLSDTELVARVKDLARREQDVTAQLVAHLAELDTRDFHLRAGYASLFTYCREALGLSEHEAYNRIEVARTSRRFPVILDMLAEGFVHLTTVRLLGPHLTIENHRAVLDSARGKRKAEVEEIVARLSPRPDVPPSLRKLPTAKAPLLSPTDPRAPSAVVPSAVVPLGVAQSGVPPSGVASTPPTQKSPAPPSSAGVTPLSPDRFKLELTIGADTLEKLRLAKDMLRHAIPSGDEAALLDRALTALLADLARKKFAAAEKPRAARGTAPGSRHVPAGVKRAVWLRDLGRCAYVGSSGRRCAERAFLEFHHVHPYAAGGEATIGNVELRCRRHNDYEARMYFGPCREVLVREEATPYGRPFEGASGELVPERVGLGGARPPTEPRRTIDRIIADAMIGRAGVSRGSTASPPRNL